jgi:hypothetical protein
VDRDQPVIPAKGLINRVPDKPNIRLLPQISDWTAYVKFGKDGEPIMI